MTVDWRKLVEIVAENERFVITSHVRPDADALGSELGLARVLDRLGKQTRIINPSATPDHLKFLDPDGRVRKLREGVTIEEALDTDVHLIVDTSAWQQIADVDKVYRKTAATKVIIDHHVSSDDMGAIEFKDTSASATGVLIAELAEALDVTLTEHEAVPLFAAIATDTGWFRFSNTEGRTMRTAARLIDCGVRPNLVYQQLYERSSLARLKLHGCVLNRVAVEFEGRLAHTFVLQNDFRQTGAHPSDTEDLVNDCLTIDGVACAFILVEQRSGQIKVSLRSRTGVDVASIAEQFGGGGHRQASGAMLPGPLATAQTRVLQAMHAALQEPAG